ncbi:hypothetical protein SCLCIDRAFT_1217277 [Scleroderma citrinum Foug A]|uniref:Uncharacterized protein n=1 Tax=Scleroderma citrinum Foug A TaxID=1036808 RepID=A0A0C2ZE25_9AGAM|nr:hypothetical protein SCLCIDRAFT_1217277 [Scleroderma citrinum Foug A]
MGTGQNFHICYPCFGGRRKFAGNEVAIPEIPSQADEFRSVQWCPIILRVSCPVRIPQCIAVCYCTFGRFFASLSGPSTKEPFQSALQHSSVYCF